MSPQNIPTNIKKSHHDIISLQEEIKEDSAFKKLCLEYDLPWDLDAGYEPRWYNGPAPKDVRVLFFMAEPGAITPNEAQNLLPAVSHSDWFDGYDLNALEHYWRDNLRSLCRHIWPDKTEIAMYSFLGGSCAFWMSLPRGNQTSEVPRAVVKYFIDNYLGRFIALFPNAIVLAAGAKARDRLNALSVPFEQCSALTRPESNKPRAIKSWRRVGKSIASMLSSETGEMTPTEKTSTSARSSEAIPIEKSNKSLDHEKCEHDQASIAFITPRENDRVALGEAHALAVRYGNKEAASSIHQAIAACVPESGYRILLHYPRCTYGQHFSESLAEERRWGSDHAIGLPERFHELARMAIKHKDDIKNAHDDLYNAYKKSKKSNDIANKFRNKIRKIMNEAQ